MIKKITLSLFIIVTCALCADFDNLENTKKKHPDFFVPGNVVKFEYRNEMCYIFNGHAEQLFDGDFAETDAELAKEAELDAKQNLYLFLTKGDKELTVTMSAATIVFSYKDKNIYGKIMAVPVKNVTVKRVARPPQNYTVNSINTTQNNAINPPLGASNPQPSLNNAQNNTPKAVEVAPKAVDAAPKTVDVVSKADNDRITSAEEAKGDNANTGNELSKEAIMEQRISKNLERLKDKPNDIILLMKMARLYESNNNINDARKVHSKIVQLITSNKNVNVSTASEAIINAAEFEDRYAAYGTALKYYRIFIKSNNLYKWNLNDSAREINTRISQLVLKLN